MWSCTAVMKNFISLLIILKKIIITFLLKKFNVNNLNYFKQITSFPMVVFWNKV